MENPRITGTLLLLSILAGCGIDQRGWHQDSKNTTPYSHKDIARVESVLNDLQDWLVQEGFQQNQLPKQIGEEVVMTTWHRPGDENREVIFKIETIPERLLSFHTAVVWRDYCRNEDFHEAEADGMAFAARYHQWMETHAPDNRIPGWEDFAISEDTVPEE